MRTHTLKLIAIAVAASTNGGCELDVSGWTDSIDPPTSQAADGDLQQRLGHRQSLVLEPPSTVGVAALNDRGQAVPCVHPTVVGGRAVLRAADPQHVIVEALAVDLTDVVLDGGALEYPRDIHLTDVRVRLGTQLVAQPRWSDDGAFMAGRGRADLLLDFAVLQDSGDAYPFATQLIRDVELDVDAELTGDGDIVAEVRGYAGGTLWDFSVLKLADLDVNVRGRALPAQP